MNEDGYDLNISDPSRIFNSLLHCLQSIRVKTGSIKEMNWAAVTQTFKGYVKLIQFVVI